MSIIPKKANPNDLTEEEVAFLRGTSVPDEVKGYLSRQHDNIGTKITAYRKVAAAARAECDALLAVRDLDDLHGELVDLADAKLRILSLQRKADALEVTVARKDDEILRRTAAPALAVHSGRG